MKKIPKSLWVTTATVATFSFLAQPASALIFDWQFTNENGNVGSSTDIVSGNLLKKAWVGSPQKLRLMTEKLSERGRPG